MERKQKSQLQRRRTTVVKSGSASKGKVSSIPQKNQKGQMDPVLFTLLIVLVSFGLIMVFSASSINAYYEYGNSYHYLFSQGRWALLGFVMMLFFAKADYHVIVKRLPLMMGITVVLLLLVLIAGNEINGAKRWLGVGGFSIQPSELAKIVLIVFLSHRLSLEKEGALENPKALGSYLIVIGAFCGLVLAEKHLSGTIVLAAVSLLLLFVAGVKSSHIALAFALASVVGVIAVIQEPYRLERITTFMDPFANKMDEGWQIVQSLYAIGSGGMFGVGLGRSRQKYLYIPEPHNDFIFSIICEELGLLGAALVIALFALLVWRGIKIALSAPDKLGTYLSFGMTGLIAIQAIINIAVVTASMPVTGMQLPFFSAGGSSLVFLLSGMGIMLNVSRQCRK